MPLGNASHFPPFKQVSLGWEHRRPGEGREERSGSGAAGPSAGRGISRPLPRRLCCIMGLLGEGAPGSPRVNPKGRDKDPKGRQCPAQNAEVGVRGTG